MERSFGFLQKFSGTNYNHISTGIVEERMQMKDNSYNLTAIMRPNNPKILGYYLKRGIEPETVKKHLKQVHYQVRAEGKDFHFFGVGIKNNSGGWDVRSTDGKTKLGTSDISEFGNPNSDKVVVLRGCRMFLPSFRKE